MMCLFLYIISRPPGIWIIKIPGFIFLITMLWQPIYWAQAMWKMRPWNPDYLNDMKENGETIDIERLLFNIGLWIILCAVMPFNFLWQASKDLFNPKITS